MKRQGYLHLAHNEWDPAAGRAVPKVLYSFGREDALDRAAIKRLVASLSKLLDPADALAATAGSDLVFLESRPFGGAFVLDALWRRLGIDKVIAGLDHGPRRGRPRDAAATETLQQAIGKGAKNNQRRRHQRRQHRAADTGLGNVHGQLPATFGGRGLTRVPSDRSN